MAAVNTFEHETVCAEPALPAVTVVPVRDEAARSKALSEADSIIVALPRVLTAQEQADLRGVLPHAELFSAFETIVSELAAETTAAKGGAAPLKEGMIGSCRVAVSARGTRRLRSVHVYGVPGVLEPMLRARGTEAVCARRLAALTRCGETAMGQARKEKLGAGGGKQRIAIVVACSEHFGRDEDGSIAGSRTPDGKLIDESAIISLVRGVYLGSWVDRRFKGGGAGSAASSPPQREAEVSIVFDVLDVEQSSIQDIPLQEASVARGILLARQLVDARGNIVTPSFLAETARRLAAAHPTLECTVLDRSACEKRGMGCFLAVAQGSSQPPQFIHLVHRARSTAAPAGGGERLPKIVLIGKGITFDSGGLQPKSALMDCMHLDKAAACALLGAAAAIAAEGLPAEVHFIAPCAENMSGSSAYRPGDVLRASNGKTVTVGHTDAEGRLALADALVYAQELGADCIVDLATLTGAAMIALGPEYGAALSNDADLLELVLSAADDAGEKLWPMPLATEYASMLSSELTDLKSVGGKWGGCITAALFLREFIPDKVPWAHLDIAGCVYNQKDEVATGYGVALLYEFVALKVSQSAKALQDDEQQQQLRQ